MGSNDDTKLVSKTGAVGAALGIYGIVKFFFPTLDSYVPPGLIEAIAGGLVVLFRKISDGKTPKIV